MMRGMRRAVYSNRSRDSTHRLAALLGQDVPFQLELGRIWRSVMQFERISHDPAVMGGKPCIRGLRVTVGMLLGLLATGQTRERILSAYPYLESDDIDAALAYAAWRMEEREEPLVGR